MTGTPYKYRGTLSEYQWRRWVGWTVISAGFLLVSFHRVTTTVLTDELMRAFDSTGAELGILHASFFYVYALLQIPAGILVDRKGPRRVATGGGVLMSLGIMGFAFSDSYALSIATRTLIGIGGSVFYVTALRFCANWFKPTEYATLAGLTVALAGAGGILASTPFAASVAAFGWRPTVLITGVGGLVLTTVTYVVVRDTPDAAGLSQPDGLSSSASARPRTWSTVICNTKSVLSRWDTWVIGLLLFFVIGTDSTVFGLWAIPYLVHSYALSTTSAANFVLVANIGLLIGPPIVGRLSDKLRMRTELIVASAILWTAGYGLIAVLGTPPLIAVGATFFLVMFLEGGFTLAYTVVKERHSSNISGTSTGAINSIGFFGGALIPAVMGGALDVFWTGEVVAGVRVYTLTGYRAAFLIATSAGLLALVCSVAIYIWRPADE